MVEDRIEKEKARRKAEQEAEELRAAIKVRTYGVWLQTTQLTSGGSVTAVTNCCANCVEFFRLQQWGPDLPFLGKPVMRTRWMAHHKSG